MWVNLVCVRQVIAVLCFQHWNYIISFVIISTYRLWKSYQFALESLTRLKHVQPVTAGSRTSWIKSDENWKATHKMSADSKDSLGVEELCLHKFDPKFRFYSHSFWNGHSVGILNRGEYVTGYAVRQGLSFYEKDRLKASFLIASCPLIVRYFMLQ